MLRRLGAAVALVLLLAAAAWADGKVLHRILAKPVRTPDQRALVRWDEASRTETLVVETTVEGEGTDFAWVLPLPSVPKIEASTAGLFPTLSLLTSPVVRDDRDPSWVLVAALGLGLWATIRWWRRPLRRRVAGLALPVSTTLGLALALAMAPPTCARDAAVLSSGAPTADVRVLARERVGLFDTTTLAADDAAALRRWLAENDFAAPAEMEPVVAEYVREGWIFVASKVRRDAATGSQRIHPLAFTFPATAAVYPMRLTGVGAERLALELYVLGDRRAAADGLTVEDCREVPPDAWEHEEIARRSGGAEILTKLAGDLDATAMSRDVALRWEPYTRHEVTLYTPGAAADIALLPAAWAWGGVLLVAAVASRRRASTERTLFARWDGGSFVVAMLVALGVATPLYLRLPRVPESALAGGWYERIAEKEIPAAVLGDAEALRSWVRQRRAGEENPWTGGPIREEDSPGNWTVRERGPRVDLVFHSVGSARVLDVSRRVTVEGTVRTSSGAPARGVGVKFRSPPDASEPNRWTGVEGDTTDEAGAFRVELSAGFVYDVEVAPKGGAYRRVPSFDPARAERLDLVLPRERSVRGRVLGEDGKPLAGAVVYANPRSPFDANEQRSATTGAEGTFEIGGFDAEADEVVAWLHVHEPARCREGVTVRIPRGDDTPVELRVGPAPPPDPR